MAGGRRTYFEISCPKCGKPSIDNGRVALNKVQPPKVQRAKCVNCGEYLIERS
jgi:predicted RNA-binding Zn-ribbon protein involved in translation (DUF1610 family)